MSALPREALEESPLADLHVLAAELGIDGYRRLRKADLIDRIVGAQGGAPAADEPDDDDDVPADDAPVDDASDDEEDGVTDEEPKPARTRSRGGRRERERREPRESKES